MNHPDASTHVFRDLAIPRPIDDQLLKIAVARGMNQVEDLIVEILNNAVAHLITPTPKVAAPALIPENVLEAAKKRANKTGKSLQEVIGQFAEAGLVQLTRYRIVEK